MARRVVDDGQNEIDPIVISRVLSRASAASAAHIELHTWILSGDHFREIVSRMSSSIDSTSTSFVSASAVTWMIRLRSIRRIEGCSCRGRPRLRSRRVLRFRWRYGSSCFSMKLASAGPLEDSEPSPQSHRGRAEDAGLQLPKNAA